MTEVQTCALPISNNGAASGTCNRPGITQFHGTFHWIYGGSGLDSTDPGPQADLRGLIEALRTCLKVTKQQMNCTSGQTIYTPL